MPRRRRRKQNQAEAGADVTSDPVEPMLPPPNARAMMKWGAIGIVAIAGLAHLNSLYAKHFVYRDAVFFDALLDAHTNARETKLFRGPEPLVLWSFEINRKLNALNAPPANDAPGFQPLGFHVGNVLLHIGAALMLALLVREAALGKPMRSRGQPIAGGAEALGIAAALIWAVHPVQTDAVAYLANRGAILGGGFTFASLWFYLLFARRSMKPAILGSILCGLFAVLSGRTAIVLPIAALLLDGTTVAGSVKGAMRARWDGLVALLAVSIVGVYVAARAPLSSPALLDSNDAISSGAYLLTQAALLLDYLKLVVAPTNLSIIHVVDPVSSAPDVLVPLAVTVAALVISVVLAWRKNIVGTLLLLALLFLVPTSSAFPLPDLMEEHRIYTPLAALIVLACMGVIRISASITGNVTRGGMRGWEVGLGLCAIASAALGYQTRQRNHDFADQLTLWRATVAAEPGSAVAHASLAAALLQEGKISEARFSARQAYEIDPTRADAMTTEGLALAALGDDEQAVESYKRAVVAAPKYEPAWYNLAKARVRLRRIPEAIDAFHWAIEIYDSARARNDFGVLLLEREQFRLAEEHLRRAIELDPSMTRAYFNLGNALARQGKTREAIEQFYIAIGQDNRYVRAYQNLGGALIEEQIYDEAIEVLMTASSIEPGNELTQQLLTIAENKLDRAGGGQ